MGGTRRPVIPTEDEKGLIERSRRVTGQEGHQEVGVGHDGERFLEMRALALGTNTWDPGSVGVSPHVHSLVGLAPSMAELWPSSAEKSSVCPADFSPSNWTTEGQ